MHSLFCAQNMSAYDFQNAEVAHLTSSLIPLTNIRLSLMSCLTSYTYGSRLLESARVRIIFWPKLKHLFFPLQLCRYSVFVFFQNISILYYAFKDLSRKILNYFSNPSPKGEAHYCASRWSTKFCKSVLVALTMLGTLIPSAVSIRATSSPFRTTGSPAFVTLGCAL